MHAAGPKGERTTARRAAQPPGPQNLVRVESWLAGILRNRWQVYRERLAECRKKPSEESVHELRVGTRKLIAVFTLLDRIVPGGKLQKACRILKRQLRSMSALRDVHVQRFFIERQVEEFPALWFLRVELERRERGLVKAASREIVRFETAKLERQVSDLSLGLVRCSMRTGGRSRLTTLALRSIGKAFVVVVERRQRIDFSDLRTVHRTRVAFKKFRYLLECLPPQIGGFSPRDLRQLAGYQRKMGNIQDLNLMLRRVRSFVRKQPGLALRLAPFCASLERRRTGALRTFRKNVDALSQFWPPRMTMASPRPAAATSQPAWQSVERR